MIDGIYKLAGIQAVKTWKRCGSPRYPTAQDCAAEAYLAVAGAGDRPAAVIITIARRRVIDAIRKELGRERRDAKRPAIFSLRWWNPSMIALPIPKGQSRYAIARRRYHERNII